MFRPKFFPTSQKSQTKYKVSDLKARVHSYNKKKATFLIIPLKTTHFDTTKEDELFVLKLAPPPHSHDMTRQVRRRTARGSSRRPWKKYHADIYSSIVSLIASGSLALKNAPPPASFSLFFFYEYRSIRNQRYAYTHAHTSVNAAGSLYARATGSCLLLLLFCLQKCGV